MPSLRVRHHLWAGRGSCQGAPPAFWWRCIVGARKGRKVDALRGLHSGVACSGAFGGGAVCCLKKIQTFFCVISLCWLNNQSVGNKSTKFFAEKCLTVELKRRIKPFAPTSRPRPKGRRKKKFFRMAKKVLDAGLKMRHKSPSRQRVAPTGPRKKTFAKMKKLVDSENEAA